VSECLTRPVAAEIFFYVSLQLLLELEKEVISFGTEIDVPVEPRVGVQQLKAVENQSLRVRTGAGVRANRLSAMAARQRF